MHPLRGLARVYERCSTCHLPRILPSRFDQGSNGEIEGAPFPASQLDRSGTSRGAQHPQTHVKMQMRLACEAGLAAQAQHIPFVHDVADRHLNAAYEVTIRAPSAPDGPITS